MHSFVNEAQFVPKETTLYNGNSLETHLIDLNRVEHFSNYLQLEIKVWSWLSKQHFLSIITYLIKLRK
jgi:hypothetical protein